jgi:hypothetical protein
VPFVPPDNQAGALSRGVGLIASVPKRRFGFGWYGYAVQGPRIQTSPVDEEMAK